MKALFGLIILFNVLLSIELERPKTYQNQSINNWIMSEKLDGIRAYWDGEKLLTKNGNIIHSSIDFTQNFPPFKLDGELWTRRNDFENIQSIVLDKIPSNQWEKITYNIFEVPHAQGNFLQRLQKAKVWFKSHPNQHVKFIPQYHCQDKKALNTFLESILQKNCEGVIVKNPNHPYISKRNSNILKVKKFYDMEGEVVGYNYNKERLKSLIIQLKSGTSFNLGSGLSNKERLNPPKIGEKITFKYYGWTKKGKPKFASYLRLRQKE